MVVTHKNSRVTASKSDGGNEEHKATLSDECEIGRGRSGIVYKVSHGSRGTIARKVFDSSGLTKFVQWVTLGAPNPYVWNEDAVQCAKLRRNILSRLVPFWTQGRVGVANATSVLRNEEIATFELHTQFINGRPAALRHTLSSSGRDEAEILWHEVMPALRHFLASSGFDGLLWQAGIGNPVAFNNFLFDEGGVQKSEGNGTADGRWVWIDLESGVPAIFPISPKVFFQYSMSFWLHNRRFSFDDVDIRKLQRYLDGGSDNIKRELGDDVLQEILRDVRRLEKHQSRWKSVGRIDSSIQYRLARRDITEESANYFSRHKLQWVLRETGRAVVSLPGRIKRTTVRLIYKLKNLHLLQMAGNALLLLISQRRRELLVHDYLEGCIAHWHSRGQISKIEASLLSKRIGAPDSSVYITDFGMHIAIKPIVKGIQYVVLPALFAVGFLSAAAATFMIVAGGAIVRTIYTLSRVVQLSLRGGAPPWIALGVGILPMVGNLAFPTQIIFSIRGEDEILARFMIDDGFARIGRHMPIWGGEDTWTEHFFNRIPSKSIELWASRWKESVRS